MRFILIEMLVVIVPNLAVLIVCGTGWWFQWFCRGAIWWFFALVGYEIISMTMGSVLHGNIHGFVTNAFATIFLLVVARRWYKGITKAWKNLPGWVSMRRAERRKTSGHKILGPP